MKAKIAQLIVLLVGCAALAAAQSNTPQEEKNKEMVLNWWREVVTNGHVELASKYMAETYVEHNPNMSGGRAEFVAGVGQKAKKPVDAKLPKQPVMALGKDDYVVLVWEIDDVDAKGKAFKYNNYDILRIQDGKIQEHWDGEVKR